MHPPSAAVVCVTRRWNRMSSSLLYHEKTFNLMMVMMAATMLHSQR